MCVHEPKCIGGCGNGTCIAPSVCRCDKGYHNNNITILYRKLTLTVLIAILTNILNLGVFLCVKPAANKKTVQRQENVISVRRARKKLSALLTKYPMLPNCPILLHFPFLMFGLQEFQLLSSAAYITYRVLYHSNSKLDDDFKNCNLATIFFVFFFR